MTLGQRLYQFRTERNMSQQTLATKAKVAISTISMVENGVRDGEQMSIAVAKRLARVLKVTLDEFAGVKKGKSYASQNGSITRTRKTREATQAA